MLIDSRKPIGNTGQRPSGVVIDHGTGKRIPFVIWCDFATGDYEAHVPAANGVDVMVDAYTRVPFVRKGKAVGKLELVPFAKAAAIGCTAPKKVVQIIQPMTKDERINGMEEYKRVFKEVWKWRGNSERVVNSQWDNFLMNSDFLDDFCLRRTVIPTGVQLG